MTCPICNQQTNTDTACNKCTTRITRWLHDILEYQALATNELQPTKGGDGRSTERSLGIRIDALDLICGLDVLPTLESWEAMFRSDWQWTPLGPITEQRAAGQPNQARAYLTGTIHFLTTNIDRIAQHPAIDDFHNETRDLHRQAQTAANQTSRSTWRINCPTDTDTGRCANNLRISGDELDGTTQCRQCHTTWDVRRLLLVALHDSETAIWLDPEACTRLLGVDDSSLRRWHREKKVRRHSGRYCLTDVMTAVKQFHTA